VNSAIKGKPKFVARRLVEIQVCCTVHRSMFNFFFGHLGLPYIELQIQVRFV
jgi:hypothetical protein